MGTVKLFGQKLSNNDQSFFKTFTAAREELERVLIEHKDLVATILQKNMSTKRVDVYCSLLDKLLQRLKDGKSIDSQFLIDASGLHGKLIVGSSEYVGKKFNEDAKSEAFITTALGTAMKCPICNGYIDPEKSVSYDHILRAREEGIGSASNCQLTHPYCNQSIKQ